MRTLRQKLGILTGMTISLIDTPDSYLDDHISIEEKVLDITKAKPLSIDFIHIFSNDADSLRQHLAKAVPALKKDGLLWISWPKKSAKLDSDIDKWSVMKIGQDAGLVDVKILSYNEQWSSLKFVYRLTDR